MRGLLLNKQWRGFLFPKLALPMFFLLTGTGWAEETQLPSETQLPAAETKADTPAPTKSDKDEATPAFTLQACRQMALEKQPSLRAAQAGLAAALDRAQAVNNLRTPHFLAPDLPIRRQQAALGVTVAESALLKSRADVLYGVTYSYLGALYASEQEKDLKSAETRLVILLDLVIAFSKQAGRKRRDIYREHENLLLSYLDVIKARRQEAVEGRERAMAALREAMGVGPDYPLTLAAPGLGCPNVQLNRDEIIALALARRGELMQATTAVQVNHLEAEAQATLTHRSRSATYASGTDLHIQAVPEGSYALEYRPTAIGPEMPVMLYGSCQDRVAQAHDYQARAEAVATKTRNLIVLEAETSWLRWKQKNLEAEKLALAAANSSKLSQRLRDKFDPRNPVGGYPSLDDVINSGVVTNRLRAEAFRARFDSLVTLAILERVTGGGFCVDFDAAPPCKSEETETPATPK